MTHVQNFYVLKIRLIYLKISNRVLKFKKIIFIWFFLFIMKILIWDFKRIQIDSKR